MSAIGYELRYKTVTQKLLWHENAGGKYKANKT
jgi:hypothetical protein